jgi:hypothetical protein
MLCHGQYEPWMVALDANGELDKPEYIETLAKNHVLRANQNVFAFSMNVASLELMHLIQMIAGPGGKFRSRAQRYNVKTGEMELPDTASIEEECKPGCIFPPLTARGDTATHPGTGRHPAAEQARGNRSFQGPSMAKSPGREASPGPTPNWSAKILEDARQWLSNRLSRQ